MENIKIIGDLKSVIKKIKIGMAICGEMINEKYVVRFMVFYILSIGCLLGIIIYSYQNKIDRHNEQVERIPGVWKLSDEYDNRNSGCYGIPSSKNSLRILKKYIKN